MCPARCRCIMSEPDTHSMQGTIVKLQADMAHEQKEQTSIKAKNERTIEMLQEEIKQVADSL